MDPPVVQNPRLLRKPDGILNLFLSGISVSIDISFAIFLLAISTALPYLLTANPAVDTPECPEVVEYLATKASSRTMAGAWLEDEHDGAWLEGEHEFTADTGGAGAPTRPKRMTAAADEWDAEDDVEGVETHAVGAPRLRIVAGDGMRSQSISLDGSMKIIIQQRIVIGRDDSNVDESVNEQQTFGDHRDHRNNNTARDDEKDNVVEEGNSHEFEHGSVDSDTIFDPRAFEIEDSLEYVPHAENEDPFVSSLPADGDTSFDSNPVPADGDTSFDSNLVPADGDTSFDSNPRARRCPAHGDTSFDPFAVEDTRLSNRIAVDELPSPANRPNEDEDASFDSNPADDISFNSNLPVDGDTSFDPNPSMAEETGLAHHFAVGEVPFGPNPSVAFGTRPTHSVRFDRVVVISDDSDEEDAPPQERADDDGGNVAGLMYGGITYGGTTVIISDDSDEEDGGAEGIMYTDGAMDMELSDGEEGPMSISY
ncbi:hypothetical protein DFP72DRAFT_846013 [Ephemerocybe angulata]|uniref:Uncharacterized protein n=1 Tax=Ephemerocybe angulata TaxID=980116 RepID=A0A8H6I384_9AGAR|nr:hypothetical protein DFP72DRAFT_846013 [Tulosesus angulatus]